MNILSPKLPIHGCIIIFELACHVLSRPPLSTTIATATIIIKGVMLCHSVRDISGEQIKLFLVNSKDPLEFLGSLEGGLGKNLEGTRVFQEDVLVYLRVGFFVSFPGEL